MGDILAPDLGLAATSWEQDCRNFLALQQDQETARGESQDSEEKVRRLQEATSAQNWLEATSSQLTEHGLLSLLDGLRNGELAILFRNNHFNTIFAHRGAIWILVTDQGYMFEQDVVWERLCDVSGNTEFAKSDFSRFQGRPASQDVAVAADLAQAAFSSVVPCNGIPDSAARADPDADMALAMQLQDEENQRLERFAQQQQAASDERPATKFSGSRQSQKPPKRPQNSRSDKQTQSKPSKCSMM